MVALHAADRRVRVGVDPALQSLGSSAGRSSPRTTISPSRSTCSPPSSSAIAPSSRNRVVTSSPARALDSHVAGLAVGDRPQPRPADLERPIGIVAGAFRASPASARSLGKRLPPVPADPCGGSSSSCRRAKERVAPADALAPRAARRPCPAPTSPPRRCRVPDRHLAAAVLALGISPRSRCSRADDPRYGPRAGSARGRLGPRAAAPRRRSTASRSSRKSQCRRRAWCSWITKRPRRRPGRARAARLRRALEVALRAVGGDWSRFVATGCLTDTEECGGTPDERARVRRLVIGAGPAGEVCAGRARRRRACEVALVEHQLIGGECSFYACMPSKALLRPGELLAEVERVPGGASRSRGALDAGARLAPSRRGDPRPRRHAPAAVAGGARDRALPRPRGARRRAAVVAGAERLRAAKAVVIATGTTAAVPPIEGLAEARPWTNREATTADRGPGAAADPRRRRGRGRAGAGLGAASGPASPWSRPRTGCCSPRSRSRASRSPPVSSAHGVEVRTGAKAIAASRGDGGQVSLQLEGGEELRGDELLVAVGRRPRTDRARSRERRGRVGRLPRGRRPAAGRGLGLALRDRRRQRPLPAHPHGQVPGADRADVILGKDVAATRRQVGSPRVVFTEPQVAAVGLTLGGGRGAGDQGAGRRRRDRRQRRGQLHRPQRRGHLADRRRRRARA